MGRKQTLSPSNCGVWEERSPRKRLSQHRSLGPSLTLPRAALRGWGEKVQALWDSWPEKDPRPMGKLGPTRGAEDRRGRASHAWEPYEVQRVDRQTVYKPPDISQPGPWSSRWGHG